MEGTFRCPEGIHDKRLNISQSRHENVRCDDIDDENDDGDSDDEYDDEDEVLKVDCHGSGQDLFLFVYDRIRMVFEFGVHVGSALSNNSN